MAKDDLWVKPHNISNDKWWYEEPQGISVVVHVGNGVCKIVDIPWKSIRASLRRLDK